MMGIPLRISQVTKNLCIEIGRKNSLNQQPNHQSKNSKLLEERTKLRWKEMLRRNLVADSDAKTEKYVLPEERSNKMITKRCTLLSTVSGQEEMTKVTKKTPRSRVLNASKPTIMSMSP